MMQPDETVNDSVAVGDSVTSLADLPDSQVYDRDAEDYTKENLDDTLRRLRKVVLRQRKARADDAEVAELAGKLKKANAATRKAKAKKGVAAGNVMETTI